MNILHVSSEKNWRGGEQQIAYLIKGSPEENHYVFCRTGSAFAKYCRKEKIPFTEGSFHPLAWVSSAFRLIQYGEETAADIIHLHTGKAHILGYVALHLGLKKPVVASRRVAVTPSESLLTRKRYDHPGVRKIICISTQISQIMSEYLTDPRKVTTIHSGIDTEKFGTPEFEIRSKLDIPPDHHVIGTVSALTAEKDIHTFLKTAEMLLAEGAKAHFVIVGDGILRLALEEETARSGLKEHVSFTGHVSNPGDYLQQFDLFLFTSKMEGLGTSILDAFACHVPVVASNTGGIPEIVVNGETGYTVAPGSARAFQEAVQKLLEDSEKKKAFTRNAFIHLQNFTYQEMAKKTIACYRELIPD